MNFVSNALAIAQAPSGPIVSFPNKKNTCGSWVPSGMLLGETHIHVQIFKAPAGPGGHSEMILYTNPTHMFEYMLCQI